MYHRIIVNMYVYVKWQISTNYYVDNLDIKWITKYFYLEREISYLPTTFCNIADWLCTVDVQVISDVSSYVI